MRGLSLDASDSNVADRLGTQPSNIQVSSTMEELDRPRVKRRRSYSPPSSPAITSPLDHFVKRRRLFTGRLSAGSASLPDGMPMDSSSSNATNGVISWEDEEYAHLPTGKVIQRRRRMVAPRRAPTQAQGAQLPPNDEQAHASSSGIALDPSPSDHLNRTSPAPNRAGSSHPPQTPANPRDDHLAAVGTNNTNLDRATGAMSKLDMHEPISPDRVGQSMTVSTKREDMGLEQAMVQTAYSRRNVLLHSLHLDRLRSPADTPQRPALRGRARSENPFDGPPSPMRPTMGHTKPHLPSNASSKPHGSIPQLSVALSRDAFQGQQDARLAGAGDRASPMRDIVGNEGTMTHAGFAHGDSTASTSMNGTPRPRVEAGVERKGIVPSAMTTSHDKRMSHDPSKAESITPARTHEHHHERTQGKGLHLDEHPARPPWREERGDVARSAILRAKSTSRAGSAFEYVDQHAFEVKEQERSESARGSTQVNGRVIMSAGRRQYSDLGESVNIGDQADLEPCRDTEDLMHITPEREIRPPPRYPHLQPSPPENRDNHDDKHESEPGPPENTQGHTPLYDQQHEHQHHHFYRAQDLPRRPPSSMASSPTSTVFDSPSRLLPTRDLGMNGVRTGGGTNGAVGGGMGGVGGSTRERYRSAASGQGGSRSRTSTSESDDVLIGNGNVHRRNLLNTHVARGGSDVGGRISELEAEETRRRYEETNRLLGSLVVSRMRRGAREGRGSGGASGVRESGREGSEEDGNVGGADGQGMGAGDEGMD